MKNLFFFSISFLLTISLIAQKSRDGNPDLPPFGKIDKADLEMKSCDFDDKAEALVFLEDGQLDYIFGSGMELTKRVRIKILSNKGLDMANIHIRYLTSGSDREEIRNLEAQTYN